jgi:O-antigen/teichoic acid export membrane protein
MMQKRQVFINAAMSIVQVVWLGAIHFILYQFLLRTIGVEQLGIWSVVLATTAISRISDLGLSGSVVKFVAKYMAHGEQDIASRVVQTAVLSVGTLVGMILLIIYPFVRWLLSYIIPESGLKLALSILPYAFVSLWITAITNVFQAGLDGCQRIDLRSVLLISGVTFYLLLCLMLVPPYGLMGSAYAQVIQASTMLIGSWFLLRRLLTALPIIPYKWSSSLVREMAGYGVNLEIVSIFQMLYDPITKGLLSKFGGLSMVGYYEMASKMIRQLRELIVSINRVLVPTIADLQEKKPQTIQAVYRDSYRLVVYLSFPLFSIIIASIPIISELWIGNYEGTFVLFAILLAIGWFLSTSNVPAYFTNLGIGEPHWNTVGHVMIGILNLVLGLLCGKLFGGIGVVVAWVFSLAAGSNIITLAYHLKHKISLGILMPRESRGVALVSGASMFTTLLIYYQLRSLNSNPIAINSLVSLAPLAFIPVAMWLHPMRKQLLSWIGQYLLKARGRP